MRHGNPSGVRETMTCGVAWPEGSEPERRKEGVHIEDSEVDAGDPVWGVRT